MRLRALNLRPGENMMHLLLRRKAERMITHKRDIRSRISNPRIATTWLAIHRRGIKR